MGNRRGRQYVRVCLKASWAVPACSDPFAGEVGCVEVGGQYMYSASDVNDSDAHLLET